MMSSKGGVNALVVKEGGMRIWLVTVGETVPSLRRVPNPRLMQTGTLARRLVERGHEGPVVDLLI